MLLASVRSFGRIPSCLKAQYWFANRMVRVTLSEVIGEKLLYMFCYEKRSVGSVELD